MGAAFLLMVHGGRDTQPDNTSLPVLLRYPAWWVSTSALYQAVADILAVVFRAQAEVRRQEALRRSRNASGDAAGKVIRP